MSPLPDEDRQLESLLRAIPAPEPPPGFPVAARRRYLEAIEARYRREVVTGLVAAVLGLVLVATLAPTLEPTTVIAWLAEFTADVARWTTGASAVVSLVPPIVSTSVALAFVVSALSLVVLARVRSLAEAK